MVFPVKISGVKRIKFYAYPFQINLYFCQNFKAMDPNKRKHTLVNKYSRADLQKMLNAEVFKRKTVSFYKYVIIGNPDELRHKLFAMWAELNCLGRIYVANEGINAQMSVPEYNWALFENKLRSFPEFSDVPFKIAVEDDGKSFIKLSVKVRNQIVADGLNISEYDVTNVGTHLSAKEWNEKMEKGALVVDMRNYYESEIGHFDGAILPQAETFREELPEVLDKLKGKEEEEILLYCTGGVRCEKTSAYLKHHGFQKVNQLLGGIIDYARQLEEEDLPNKFKGKNFVFDERLGEKISEEVISHCHQCGEKSDVHTNCKNVWCNLLYIQCPKCAEKNNGCCSKTCQTIFLAPEEEKEAISQKLGFQKGPRYYRKESFRL